MSERTRGETVKRLLLLALWSVLLFPLSAADWTVLVYMAADNNLWQNAVADVNSMESVSLPANLNLIVQTDMPADSGYPGGQRRKIRPDNSPSITSPLLESLGTIDSGDPQTLASFANWGFQKYPSQRRMLVIWGHGDNWFKADEGKWICPDEGAQSLISVSDGELKEALSGLPRLDILLFDACSMQSLEVLAEVGQAADIVIASEELVPAAGFPYQTIVPLFADGGVEEIAGQMEVGDAAVLGLEIDDDELSARNLVLTVHDSSLGAGHARAGTRASNQVTRSLTTSSRETSLKISCRAPG